MPEELPPAAVRAAQRKAVYDFNAEQASLARVAQAGNLRWLLSALTLVHFTALLALHAHGAAAHGLQSDAQWPLALGLTFALLAGLAAWINAAFSAIVHAEWADVRLLDPHADDAAGESRAKKRVVNATSVLAVLFAALSCLAAPWAILLLARG